MPAPDLDSIKSYLDANRDSLDENPSRNHNGRFLLKLNERFRRIVSIVPYILRVAVITIVVFTCSILVWDNFIRKDRHEVTLREKITRIW